MKHIPIPVDSERVMQQFLHAGFTGIAALFEFLTEEEATSGLIPQKIGFSFDPDRLLEGEITPEEYLALPSISIGRINGLSPRESLATIAPYMEKLRNNPNTQRFDEQVGEIAKALKAIKKGDYEKIEDLKD